MAHSPTINRRDFKGWSFLKMILNLFNLDTKMKTLPYFALLIFVPILSNASSCVAIDYQELKDMSTEDVIKEFCKASRTVKSNNIALEPNSILFELHTKLGQTKIAKEESDTIDKYNSDNEQCGFQISRIKRILIQKSVEESQLEAICVKPK